MTQVDLIFDQPDFYTPTQIDASFDKTSICLLENHDEAGAQLWWRGMLVGFETIHMEDVRWQNMMSNEMTITFNVLCPLEKNKIVGDLYRASITYIEWSRSKDIKTKSPHYL